MKRYLQEAYDWLRLRWPFAKVVNFFIGRERAFRARAAEAGQRALEQLPKAEDGSFIIAGGIFSGMKWPDQTLVGSEFVPKILGTYELELQKIFRDLLRERTVSSFVDIGAAEGYYAVGAAMLRPSLPVFAYEIQEEAHAGIQKLAEVNGVSASLRVRSIFSTEDADAAEFGSSPLVLVDIEGAEAGLMDEGFVSLFAKAVIMVEVHDFLDPGTGMRLRKRWEATHRVRQIDYVPRARQGLRQNLRLSKLDWLFATDEKRVRGLNYWLVAMPRK